jgi:hypothetical protein
MPSSAKAYLTVVLASGAVILGLAARLWTCASPVEFAAFLGFTVVASTLKVRIPGMTGTMSPNFVFLLLGMAVFSFSEVVAGCFAAAVVQSLWRPKQRPQLIQILFSAAGLVISGAAAFSVSHYVVRTLAIHSVLALVILAGTIYLSLNTVLVAIVVSLVEGQAFQKVFQRCFEWVFPLFLMGIILTGLISGSVSGVRAWQSSFLLLPVAVLAYLHTLGRSKRTTESGD